MLALNKGIVVNDGYGIVDMNVLIDNFLDVDLSDVDLGDIYTVGTIVAMAIVYFPGSQRNP
jgi:hypothetical protein